ncbi:MAG: BamA/TamA family outer membrane protein [Chitinispirillales bacterium]|jgi:outer membrane protein insertion porin family|nr:BamA/TamA family outer membrane protein [Chitinispirillales bacterium]
MKRFQLFYNGFCRAALIVLALCAVTGAEVQWRVRSIEFSGNDTYSNKELRSLMELRSRNAPYTDFVMRSDLAALRSFYKSRGFQSALVTAQSVARDSTNGRVRINIKVTEGPRIHISRVSVTPDNFLMTQGDLKKLSVKTGMPLTHSQLRADGRAIKEMLGHKGYLEAVVEPIIVFDSLERNAEVIFNIKEGPKIEVGKIIIEGNRGLADIVVRRELAFSGGDTLNLKSVQRSERRLYSTGLFNHVQIKPQFDTSAAGLESGDGTYNVAVHVTPSDFFRFQGGLGYSSDEAVRTSVSTSYRNMFTYGHRLTVGGKVSEITQNVEAVYSMPWLLYLPLQFDTKLYHHKYNNPKLYQGNFDGLRLSLGRQTDFYILYQVWSQWERVLWVKAPSEDIAGPRGVPANPTRSIGLGAGFDTRDNLFSPSKGIYSNAALEAAGVFGGNSNRFVKINFDNRVYNDLYKRYYWASALRTGWVRPYGSSEAVPVQDQFYGGGSSTVRGFDVNKLAVFPNGDPFKGNFYIFANIIDVRFPLFWWINGAVFLDAGNVWSDFSDISSVKEMFSDLRWAAGPGLRVDTPLKIIARLDLGFKLDRKPGESAMVLHFDLGQPF